MKLLEKATEFLTCFCNGDIEGLSSLLSEEFRFKGPFIECTSKESYIDSLHEDPPINCQIEILKTFENGEEVGIFYTFNKPNVNTLMAQYFKFNNDKIIETLLVFDSGAFTENE